MGKVNMKNTHFGNMLKLGIYFFVMVLLNLDINGYSLWAYNGNVPKMSNGVKEMNKCTLILKLKEHEKD